MDLHNIETYLRPDEFQAIPSWQPGWAWIAGGTWLFSEPQPQLNTLVDLDALGWSEIEEEGDRLCIGATCTLSRLLTYPWRQEWVAIAALQSAISALAASFKVIHTATIGGNVCLALAVGVIAPVMVLLDATYEIWSLGGAARFVAAQDFQLGIQQTVLQPGEVLRRIWIPISALDWQTAVRRIGVAATDPALSLVVVGRHPRTSAVRVCLGACVPSPHLLEFLQPPSANELRAALGGVDWLDDRRASATYRQQVTYVLLERMLREMSQ